MSSQNEYCGIKEWAPPRQIIQFQVTRYQSVDGSLDYLYVLCNDGTMWRRELPTAPWYRLSTDELREEV